MIIIRLRRIDDRREMMWVRVLAALGFAVAMDAEKTRVCLWRRHPDVVSLGKCKQVDVALSRQLSEDAAWQIVDELDKYCRRVPGGVTVSAHGRIGDADVVIEADAYTNSMVPVRAGITDTPADVIADVYGYLADGTSFENQAALGKEWDAFMARYFGHLDEDVELGWGVFSELIERVIEL